jgi:NADH-quinone oxidoreductase subunit L
LIDLVWLIPALPLAGSALNLVAGRRLGRRAGWVASIALGAAFVMAVLVLLDLLALGAEEREQAVELFEWIRVGSFTVDWTLRVDPCR